jgi:hypothetical protein
MKDKQREALRNWQSLNRLMNDFTEDEVKEMLDDELGQQVQRTTFLERLHQRYCILRAHRERDVMMER